MLLEQARTAYDAGNAKEAMRLLDEALAAEPKDPMVLNTVGMYSLARKDYAAAEGQFLSAVAADPGEPSLWLNVAQARRLKGDADAELAALNAALAIDQRYFMALLRKAELLERTGRDAPAAQAWQGVVALARQAGDLPPTLVATIEHGEEFLKLHAGKVVGEIEDRIAPMRSGLSGASTRRFDACMDVLLGKRQIYQNQCHGVHYPFLPADEYFAREQFGWLAELESHTGAIRDELRALVAHDGGHLRPYVAQDPGTPANKWTSLDRSLDWGAMFLWEYGVRNEALCERCPRTVAALEAIPRADIPGCGPTAFFSLLKPHAHIPPHTGVTNIRSIVHLPLIVPAGCEFRVGGETRAWREGEAFVFDDTIEHEAWNRSDDLRAVLIFDVWNPWLSETEHELIRAMFTARQAALGPEGASPFGQNSGQPF